MRNCVLLWAVFCCLLCFVVSCVLLFAVFLLFLCFCCLLCFVVSCVLLFAVFCCELCFVVCCVLWCAVFCCLLCICWRNRGALTFSKYFNIKGKTNSFPSKCCLLFRGAEVCVQPETCGGVAADNSWSDTDRTEDATVAEVQANNLDLDTTKVTNLDLSCDGSVLSEGGIDSSHQNQEHLNSQQHSPHHYNHSHHHHPQQNNSSHNRHRQGHISLHHIDYNTGTTKTRSQFHPPLHEQPPEITTGSHPAELSPKVAMTAASS